MRGHEAKAIRRGDFIPDALLRVAIVLTRGLTECSFMISLLTPIRDLVGALTCHES